MTTHAMAEKTDSFAVYLLEVLEDGLWKFLCDVIVHEVAFGPGGFSCVEVEACGCAEVVVIVLARDVEAA